MLTEREKEELQQRLDSAETLEEVKDVVSALITYIKTDEPDYP